jgi:hypothetical protein
MVRIGSLPSYTLEGSWLEAFNCVLYRSTLRIFSTIIGTLKAYNFSSPQMLKFAQFICAALSVSDLAVSPRQIWLHLHYHKSALILLKLGQCLHRPRTNCQLAFVSFWGTFGPLISCIEVCPRFPQSVLMVCFQSPFESKQLAHLAVGLIALSLSPKSFSRHHLRVSSFQTSWKPFHWCYFRRSSLISRLTYSFPTHSRRAHIPHPCLGAAKGGSQRKRQRSPARKAKRSRLASQSASCLELMTPGVPTTITTTRQVSHIVVLYTPGTKGLVNLSHLHGSYNDVTAASMLGSLRLLADLSESYQNWQAFIAASVARLVQCLIQALYLPFINDCPVHAVLGLVRPPRMGAGALPSCWLIIGIKQVFEKMVARIVAPADEATLPVFEAVLVALVRRLCESSYRSLSRRELLRLLLCCGDVECNPGPVKCDPLKASAITMQNAGKKNNPQVPPDAFYRESDLNIVNWNARGIQKYGLLEDLCQCMHDNGVNLAVVTETQFSLKGQPNHITSMKEFNIIYYALPDSSMLSSIATLQGKRLFGVCIIARKGLAVDIVNYGDGPCTSRMIHAKVIIATNNHSVANINVIAVYTPAQSSLRGMFFDHLLSYIASKPELLTADTIMCED